MASTTRSTDAGCARRLYHASPELRKRVTVLTGVMTPSECALSVTAVEEALGKDLFGRMVRPSVLARLRCRFHFPRAKLTSCFVCAVAIGVAQGHAAFATDDVAVFRLGTAAFRLLACVVRGRIMPALAEASGIPSRELYVLVILLLVHRTTNHKCLSYSNEFSSLHLAAAAQPAQL